MNTWMKYTGAASFGIISGFAIDHIANAKTPCDYDHKIDSEFTKTIESTKNVKRKVFPYVEDARKCVMTMEVKIDSKWYDTDGMFTFSPDMSENEACKNAEQRAKEKIIRKISPEVLTSKTDMVCKQETKVVTNYVGGGYVNKNKTEKPKQNKVPEIGTVISNENIVYSQPQVVYVKPQANNYNQYYEPVNPDMSIFPNLNNFKINMDLVAGVILGGLLSN